MNELILRLDHHDERFLHALVSRRRPLLDGLMRAVTHLGGAVSSIAVALLLWAGAVPGLQAAGAKATFALAASFLVVQVLKRTISRPRPEMPVGFDSLTRAPDRFSFPSGHSAASLSIALPVAVAVGGVPGTAILLLGLVIGFSRAYLGVHYPGDIAAGWVLSLLAQLAYGLLF